MQEGQLLMTQADRDRLVTLKKAKKKLITQREAAEELEVSERQVKRLLYALKKRGDKAVVHGLRGRPSNRRIEEGIEREAVQILSAPKCTGASGRRWRRSICARDTGSTASKETVRQVDDARASCGGGSEAKSSKCTLGGRGGAGLANWCSGIPPITTGSKDEARGCT